MTHQDVAQALRAVASAEKAKASAWFFKTGPGQYGEGDQFVGVTVPEQRKIAKTFRDLALTEIEKLISSPWHEERLTGLFILVTQFQKADDQQQRALHKFYLEHATKVNNWDLVDSSAPYIVGLYLVKHPDELAVLNRLARSNNLWEKRIAVMATFAFIQQGSAAEAIKIIDIVSQDTHDLLQKACGWMLREIGKRVDRTILLDYLDKHAQVMPRTMLRYAIEHLPLKQRSHYLALKLKNGT